MLDRPSRVRRPLVLSCIGIGIAVIAVFGLHIREPAPARHSPAQRAISDAAFENTHPSSLAPSPRALAAVRTSQSSDSAPAVRRGEAVVEGAVADALGGAIPGAVITARDPHGAACGTATADAKGSFALDADAGELTLEASADAYSRAVLSVVAPIRGVRLVLAPASRIAGRVESAGVPVEGATVIVEASDGLLTGAMRVRTGMDGTFDVPGLAAGEYAVSAAQGEQRCDPVPVELAVGQPSQDVVLRLLPAAELVAQVRVGGQACHEGMLHLNGPTFRSESLSGKTELRVEGLQPGAYAIEVQCGSGVPHRETLDLQLGTSRREFDLQPGAEVRGRVVDGRGEPVANVAVNLEPLRDEQPGAVCVTDTKGTFMCQGLAPDEYDASVRSATGLESEKLRVDLTRARTADIRLRLADSASIHVSLTRPDQASGQQAFLRAPGGSILAAARNAGEFVFEHLALGKYTVLLGNQADPSSSAEVTLAHANQIYRITLAPPELLSIRGIVVDAEGMPVLDTWVRASNADRLLGVYADSARAVITDDEGRFVLHDLAPGRYDICARCESERFLASEVEAGATNVVLRLTRSPSASADARTVASE